MVFSFLKIEFYLKKNRNNEDEKKTNDNEIVSPQVKSNEQSHDESKEDSTKTLSVPLFFFYKFSFTMRLIHKIFHLTLFLFISVINDNYIGKLEIFTASSIRR